MKNYLSFITCSVIIILSVGCKKAEKAVSVQKGVVNMVAGDVKLIDKGKSVPAMVGDIVTENMKIVTGKRSKADIYIGKNVLRISENSEIVFKSLLLPTATANSETELYLQKGRLFSRVSSKLKKGDVYKVKTPTTIAAVRGTEFLVSEKNGKAYVACVGGKVDVRSSAPGDSGSVVLNQGQEVNVVKGVKLNVKELSEENRENIRSIILDINELKTDIREKFEKQKDEIKKDVIKQKEKNREILNNRKNKDRENIENLKEKDSENIKSIKENILKDKEKIKNPLKDFKKPDLKDVKPDLKKPGNK